MAKAPLVQADRLMDIGSAVGEDGYRYTFPVYCHAVSFRTAYGIEYTLRHRFDDTPAGLVLARRTALKVQEVLREKGVDGLDLERWANRTIYGSQAYIDEEPYIVARERDDDR
jgi:hypothetical protein